VPGSIDLRKTGGLSIGTWITFDAPSAGEVVLDGRDGEGRGFALTTTDQGSLRIELNDGTNRARWDSDPGVLTAGKAHHIVVVVDAGPKIVMFIVDGVLCDGGEARQCGWGRYEGDLGEVGGSGPIRVGSSFGGRLVRLRLHDRPLRTSEAVAHFHAGP
jgi:hypothetical protein